MHGLAMAQTITNKSLLEALQQLKTDMMSHFDSKLDNIQSSVNALTDSFSSLVTKVSELEIRVGTNQDDITNLGARVKALEKQNAYLTEKADEAENRSRASNLRFLRVPEKSEGRDMIGFVGELLTQLFGQEHFPTPPVIERAHRTPGEARRGDSRSGPRPILVKFLHFQDKLKILRFAREKNELVYKGSRVHIYPDFSAGVMEKRRLFNPIKKRLRDLGIKYALLYPATLRVEADDDITLLFRSPDEADAFIREVATKSS